MANNGRQQSSLAHAEHIISTVEMSNKSAQVLQHEAYIVSSWRRCLKYYGLDPGQAPSADDGYVGEAAVRQRRSALDRLVRIGRLEMANLYEQIAESHYVLLMSDCDGLVLEQVSEPAYNRAFRQYGLAPGFVWTEARRGTNGLGTCLQTKNPITIHLSEHFFTDYGDLSCSGAPIWGPDGSLLGVLDASCLDCHDSRLSQVHTLALVSTSARIIEQLYFLNSFQGCWILRFHARPELVGMVHDGLIAVNEGGVIEGCDSSTPRHLGLESRKSLVGHPVDHIFDVSMAEFFRHGKSHPSALWPLSCATRGEQYYASLYPPRKIRVVRARKVPKKGAVEQAPAQLSKLAHFSHGDPKLEYSLWCAQQVMDRDINILLQGETGAGKDTFAKLIHSASKRSEKPFVAINCAAIPESLIESELFGYERGAFTGARPGGMPGKIVAANGGTLFLDEIADMPLALQARLLRVIEDKEVIPLGSSSPVPVDVHIISATYKDLYRQVKERGFRPDLYYRINGIVINVPPLRDRQDKEDLIREIVAVETGGSPVQLSPSVMHMLLDYDWPGNIRELVNTIRTACALSGGQLIELEHLPPQLRTRYLPDSGVVHGAGTALDGVPSADVLATPLEQAERDRLIAELERHQWKMTETAASLKISRNTLYRKLKKYSIPNAHTH